MVDIHYYANSRGQQPVLDWMQYVKKHDKATYRKTYQMMKYLSHNGNLIASGEIKHKDIKKLKGHDIWQVRVNENRLLYFYYSGNSIVFTNQFQKKQNDTPKKEIDKAKQRKEIWAKKN
ncbi:type II toxin-antitoxin system RelE/ParE family toxin [Bacillus inaquosorum]|uniref:type II toxin-antitoxin system RelE/ParE family toxin n=1 Tax=Bacillus inaquosorum TaxID=483913 RepID=UPI00227FDFF3|nr:type II toxin-antitoxin system RelE/ParE family toxin [Bacillus inaquosorum]MCY8073222.1 type II toxin-antitoxin system RelE/ParE family toxin [Bacillus inaquosorum]MCY8279749.1 type II toxin-antitoxin system RelE/ParE family toxin [Bacillus inaquosorum]